MNAMAVFAGGHVRTGLEDNPTYDANRPRPATNLASSRASPSSPARRAAARHPGRGARAARAAWGFSGH